MRSARELARQCDYEPGCQWLCGLQGIRHRTLSGFRSDHKAALDDLFAQVLGMMSAEGLITLERVTLDGTKIKANAGGNSFRRQEKLAARLDLAREQVRWLNAQAEEEEKSAKRRAAGQRRTSCSAEPEPRCSHSRLPRTEEGVPQLPAAGQVRAATIAARLATLDHAPRRTIGDDRFQAEDGDGGGKTNLRPALADRGVSPRLDQTTLRSAAVPLSRPPQGQPGSDVGLSQLQHHAMVPTATEPACATANRLITIISGIIFYRGTIANQNGVTPLLVRNLL